MVLVLCFIVLCPFFVSLEFQFGQCMLRKCSCLYIIRRNKKFWSNILVLMCWGNFLVSLQAKGLHLSIYMFLFSFPTCITCSIYVHSFPLCSLLFLVNTLFGFSKKIIFSPMFFDVFSNCVGSWILGDLYYYAFAYLEKLITV